MRSILVVAFLSSLLFGADWDSFISDMKKQQKMYQDSNNSEVARKELMQKLSIPTEKKVTHQHSKILNTFADKQHETIKSAIPWVTNNMIKGLDKKQIKYVTDALANKKSDEMVDTIFYLFSTSQSNYVLRQFVNDAHKLEKVRGIRYYGVVQGMLSEDELAELYQPFKFNQELENKAIIKMQFMIFKDLNLKRVPAYLFSKCPASEFKYSRCENKYLVRGEIPLSQALEIVTQEDSSYDDFLQTLTRGDN